MGDGATTGPQVPPPEHGRGHYQPGRQVTVPPAACNICHDIGETQAELHDKYHEVAPNCTNCHQPQDIGNMPALTYAFLYIPNPWDPVSFESRVEQIAPGTHGALESGTVMRFGPDGTVVSQRFAACASTPLGGGVFYACGASQSSTDPETGISGLAEDASLESAYAGYSYDNVKLGASGRVGREAQETEFGKVVMTGASARVRVREDGHSVAVQGSVGRAGVDDNAQTVYDTSVHADSGHLSGQAGVSGSSNEETSMGSHLGAGVSEILIPGGSHVGVSAQADLDGKKLSDVDVATTWQGVGGNLNVVATYEAEFPTSGNPLEKDFSSRREAAVQTRLNLFPDAQVSGGVERGSYKLLAEGGAETVHTTRYFADFHYDFVSAGDETPLLGVEGGLRGGVSEVASGVKEMGWQAGTHLSLDEFQARFLAGNYQREGSAVYGNGDVNATRYLVDVATQVGRVDIQGTVEIFMTEDGPQVSRTSLHFFIPLGLKGGADERELVKRAAHFASQALAQSDDLRSILNFDVYKRQRYQNPPEGKTAKETIMDHRLHYDLYKNKFSGTALEGQECVVCHTDEDLNARGNFATPERETCVLCHPDDGTGPAPDLAYDPQEFIKAPAALNYGHQPHVGKGSSVTCLMCHDDVDEVSVATREDLVPSGHAKGTTGTTCQTCHTGLNPSLITRINEGENHLTSACPICHETDDGLIDSVRPDGHLQPNWRDETGHVTQGRGPQTEDVGTHCPDCHASPKTGYVPTKDNTAICSSCHNPPENGGAHYPGRRSERVHPLSQRESHGALDDYSSCPECHYPDPSAGSDPRINPTSRTAGCQNCHDKERVLDTFVHNTASNQDFVLNYNSPNSESSDPAVRSTHPTPVGEQGMMRCESCHGETGQAPLREKIPSCETNCHQAHEK